MGWPRKRASIWTLAPVIVLAGLLLSACGLLVAGEASSQATPDIEATVTAAVQAALATQVATSAKLTTPGTTDVQATLSAPARTAIAAQATALAPQTATPVATPPSTPSPAPTDTPSPTHTATPTPTVMSPTPTPTPSPSPTPPPTTTPTPTSTPGPGNLVFASTRDGNLEIYVMPAEALASATRVTDRPGVDSGPRWFPDGQRIAFYGQDLSVGGDFHIYAVDSDGQNLVQITTGNFNDTSLDVSPAGTKSVFLSGRVVPDALFVMNADGTNVTQLTDSGSVGAPSWSPDGSKIAFSRDGDIWVMDANGANQARLFGEIDPKSAGYAAWSPDSTKLLYATDRDTQHGNTQTIYVTDPDGDVHIPLTDDGVAPAWSPAGDKIVFQRWVGSNYELLQMNSDGSGVEQITFNPSNDFLPDWAP